MPAFACALEAYVHRGRREDEVGRRRSTCRVDARRKAQSRDDFRELGAQLRVGQADRAFGAVARDRERVDVGVAAAERRAVSRFAARVAVLRRDVEDVVQRAAFVAEGFEVVLQDPLVAAERRFRIPEDRVRGAAVNDRAASVRYWSGRKRSRRARFGLNAEFHAADGPHRGARAGGVRPEGEQCDGQEQEQPRGPGNDRRGQRQTGGHAAIIGSLRSIP